MAIDKRCLMTGVLQRFNPSTAFSFPLFAVCCVCLIFANGAFSQTLNEEAAHPWIADAPGEFVRLIDLGNVRIVVDDEKVRQANKAALTQFAFKLSYQVRLKYAWTENGVQTGLWKARIDAVLRAPRIKVEHKIVLPSSFQPPNPWKSSLLSHEFDHVAISTDPRLIKILQRIFSRKRILLEEWKQDEMPTRDQVLSRVSADADKDIRVCESMLQSQYDWLDLKSVSGVSPIESRYEFFQDLYSLSGLERCQFVHLDVAKKLFEARKSLDFKDELQRHYLYLE